MTDLLIHNQTHDPASRRSPLDVGANAEVFLWTNDLSLSYITESINDMVNLASDERSINAKRDRKIAVTDVTDFSCHPPAGVARSVQSVYRTKATG
jgi:hypothetical protein